MKRRARFRHIGCLLLSCLVASAPSAQVQTGSTALPRVDRIDRVSFTDVTGAAGLSGSYVDGNSHTGGSAWVDYNDDYLPDLFVTNGSGLPHYLYRNEGDGTFTDVSHLVLKPDPDAEDAAVKFADIDNDGDTDILVIVDSAVYMNPFGTTPPEGGPNVLYVNQGNGTFVDQALTLGVVDPGGRRNICGGFADFDRDGLVDLHLANWQMNDLPLGTQENDDRILRNLGAGGFSDVTTSVGSPDGYGRDALTCLWFDIENDGWPDLYVANVIGFPSPLLSADDVVYGNVGGSTFVDDSSNSPGVCDDAWAAMGADVGDIENDGDWDLYITDNRSGDPSPRGNVLYVNNGNGTFADNTCDLSGVCADDSWPCSFFDFDRDGWTDLWVGASHQDLAHFFFRNRGDGTFARVESFHIDGYRTRGGGPADYDADGDVDLAFTNFRKDSVLLRNDTGDAHAWLSVRLVGQTSNRMAIGAVARVTANGMTQMRRVSGGDSAHSQQEQTLHFGLGDATSATLDIDWPSGTQQSFALTELDRFVVVDEASGLQVESVSASAVYYPEARQVVVRAKSNYHGRTSFRVEGFGELSYLARSRSFTGTFSAAREPDELHLRTKRGSVLDVSVERAD